MIHAFIDTNVYLTFFSFTEEALEELRKLLAAIRERELKLWTTPQVIDELRRNREAKVADSLDALQKLTSAQRVPQMARNLPDFQQFVDAKREFEKHVGTLHAQLAEQFWSGTLAADALLRELLAAAESVPITDEVIEAARRRVDVGNPPGKKGSIGDALNWQTLLNAFPVNEDMHLVTGDSDFVSKMSKDRVSTYLANEWHDAKASEIHLYRKIGAFLDDRFPHIKVASEYEKDRRIQRLVESGSFTTTHRAIAGLSNYTDFSDQQAQDLLEALANNPQIEWIARDPDVHRFFTDLASRYRHVLDDDTATELEATLYGERSETADEDDDGDLV